MRLPSILMCNSNKCQILWFLIQFREYDIEFSFCIGVFDLRSLCSCTTWNIFWKKAETGNRNFSPACYWKTTPILNEFTLLCTPLVSASIAPQSPPPPPETHTNAPCDVLQYQVVLWNRYTCWPLRRTSTAKSAVCPSLHCTHSQCKIHTPASILGLNMEVLTGPTGGQLPVYSHVTERHQRSGCLSPPAQTLPSSIYSRTSRQMHGWK